MKLLLVLLIAGTLSADTIYFASTPNSGTDGNFTSASDIAITPDAHWAPAQNGAEWVSFEQTGIGGIVLPNSIGINDPGAVFYQSVNDYNGTSLDLNFTLWCDDSCGVYLIGPNGLDEQLAAPSFLQGPTGTYCAPAPAITCDGHGTTFNLILNPGPYALQFADYQTGLGPFGVMYYGTVTDNSQPAPVPEPGSVWLLGAVGVILLGFSIWGRRVRSVPAGRLPA
jgi:hypothetical protein